VALALTAATGLTLASPAHAVSRFEDGFDGNPYLRWTVHYDHGRSFVLLINNEQARTDNGGIWSAWFDAPSTVPARISSTPLLVDPLGTGPATCSAAAYVKKAGPGAHVPGDPRVQMTVLDRRGSVPTVLAGSTYTITNTTYGFAAFANYTYVPDRPVVVEISVTGGMAFVDDLIVNCVNIPR
jgi:hypothetical protein